jgi:predicted ribosomally synthesized peptide with nif11-like leader
VSKKDAFVFLRTLAQDPLLSKRLLSGGKEEVIKAIDEAGLSLTWEELETVVREIKGSGDEVSDDVLDLIAGGLSFGQIQEWVRVNLDKLYSPFSKK